MLPPERRRLQRCLLQGHRRNQRAGVLDFPRRRGRCRLVLRVRWGLGTQPRNWICYNGVSHDGWTTPAARPTLHRSAGSPHTLVSRCNANKQHVALLHDDWVTEGTNPFGTGPQRGDLLA